MRKLRIISESNKIVSFINKTVKSTGLKKVVLGLSGGVDSAVVASLTVSALGKENVHILFMPNGKQEHVRKNVSLMLKKLGVPKSNFHEINIAPIVNGFGLLFSCRSRDERHPRAPLRRSKCPWGESGDLDSLFQGNDRGVGLNNTRLGNIAARVRMILLFDFAKKLPALVMGTENKSEHILGYFTRYGDAASDIEPIQQLYKTEIFELAKYLHVPKSIIDQAPSANLWSGQTDEGEFGFSYREADEVIYNLFEAKKTEKQLIKQGINKETIENVRSRIRQMEFKHKTPHTIK